MPRPLRTDRPGLLHHVMNRAVGHRPLSDTPQDVNQLLGLLAEAVERCQLRVHAYSVLATHFHLLVESADGGLSRAMQRIGDLYARWFNRTRERDGHVFKSRFTSRPVDDVAYLAQVTAYIDRNPCAAGLVEHPGAYPHGSAVHYLSGGGPPWLSRERVQGLLQRITRRPYRPCDYPSLWRYAAPPGDALVAAAIERPGVEVAPIGVLSRAGPGGVQAWMRRCAEQEGGESRPRLLLPLEALPALRVGLRSRLDGPVRPRCDPRTLPAQFALAGVLRAAFGLRGAEVAQQMDCSLARAYRLLQGHAERLRTDAAYAAAVSEALAEAVAGIYARE